MQANTNNKLITVYVIYSWSSQGIREMQGKIDELGQLRTPNNGLIYDKKDYCLTLEEAKEKVEKMRLKRIESLEKQIQKLRALEF